MQDEILSVVLDEGTTKNMIVHAIDKTTKQPFDLSAFDVSIVAEFFDANGVSLGKHIMPGTLSGTSDILFTLMPEWSVNAQHGHLELRAYHNEEVYGVCRYSIAINDYTDPYITMPV